MQFLIEPAADGLLLRQYLLSRLRLSHRLLTRLKAHPNGILLDGVSVTVRATVHTGQYLTLAVEALSEQSRPTIAPSGAPRLPVLLYADDDLLVCDKPHGMPTHPSHGHHDDTLANAVARYERDQGHRNPVFHPINRLDRDTAGVVLIARHPLAAARLSESMQARRIRKVYYAILEGALPTPSGIIDAPICRAQESIITRTVCDIGEVGAKSARSHYVRVAQWTIGPHTRTLVRAEPLTGRTHQLRVHFAHIGAPIAGDTLYGIPQPADAPNISHQALHAAALTFPHPTRGKVMTVCSPLPPDMRALLPDA